MDNFISFLSTSSDDFKTPFFLSILVGKYPTLVVILLLLSVLGQGSIWSNKLWKIKFYLAQRDLCKGSEFCERIYIDPGFSFQMRAGKLFLYRKADRAFFWSYSLSGFSKLVRSYEILWSLGYSGTMNYSGLRIRQVFESEMRVSSVPHSKVTFPVTARDSKTILIEHSEKVRWFQHLKIYISSQSYNGFEFYNTYGFRSIEDELWKE